MDSATLIPKLKIFLLIYIFIVIYRYDQKATYYMFFTVIF